MIIGTVLTENQVYNGIYNGLRLKLVDLGHLPNRAMHNNADSYNAALNTMKQSGVTVIEVRNVNAGISRQQMKTNTFYINQIGRDNGDYGGGKATILDYQDSQNQTKFKRVFQPAKPQDINIEVSYKSEDTKTDQLMRAILMTVLGERSYISSYSDDGTAGDSFLILFNGEVTMDSGKVLDKRARFTVKDLILIPPILLKDNIPPAGNITALMGENEATEQLPTD